MPRRSSSGTKGLFKNHHCQRRSGDLARCDCEWSGKVGKYTIVLSKWAGVAIDPGTREKAKAVLVRMRKAIDEGTFDRAGERPSAGTDQTLAGFIPEWGTHYVQPHGLTANSLESQLGVLAYKPRRRAADDRELTLIGGMSLKRLAEGPEEIERWLNAEGKARKWSNGTWNDYHGLLNRILTQAKAWGRIGANPMEKIARRVKVRPDHFKVRHLLEDVEDRLFAACAHLNRPQHKPNRAKLTPAKADAIRAALVAGQQGKAVAAVFGVSPSIVSAIKHGDIWNPDRIAVGTKGKEMTRRLIGAFDGGLRVGEMLLVQLHHVNWRRIPCVWPDGTDGYGYEIAMPAAITKGGKTTGETEVVFACSPRFVWMLEARRFQLNGNKPSRTFVWGAEDGRQVTTFRRMAMALYALAGVPWGRAIGVVWHTTRHEYISRVYEQTKDPELTRQLARHAELETTQGYIHTRRDRLIAAAARVGSRG